MINSVKYIMSIVSSKNDVKIYYRFVNKSKIGKKPIVVFSHGLGGNWTYFKDEIKHFKRKGFPVVYFDQRGHGKSDKPDSIEEYDLKLLAEDKSCPALLAILLEKIGSWPGVPEDNKYRLDNPWGHFLWWQEKFFDSAGLLGMN